MGRWMVILWIVVVGLVSTSEARAQTLDFPELTGRVVDQAGLLSQQVERRLTDQLAALEQDKGAQLVVVTLNSLQGRVIEDYGYQLGREWGIGREGVNDGALLIVAPNDRKVRIEVGYGLEGTVTDARSRLILEDYVLANFRAGNLQKGVVDGTAALIATIREADLPEPPPASRDQEGSLPFGMVLVIFVFVVISMLRSRTLGRRRRRGPWGAYLPGSYSTGRDRGGFGGGFSSGGGGSRRSGGFGGGGGGSFGGGGASGGW